MSIRDDLKKMGESIRKSGGKRKEVAKKMSHKGEGWYAKELQRDSKAGIDKGAKPHKNVAKSNLLTKIEHHGRH